MINREEKVNHKKVLKIMRLLNLKPVCCKVKKYSSYKGTIGETAKNLINRDFKAENPCEKWFSDITEFKVLNKKLYLSPIIDGFNSEIVSYSVGLSPNMELVETMLKKAIESTKLRTNKTLIFHTDQGWQYQNIYFQNELSLNKITQSMSRKGNCNDNGLMEGFFGKLKSEWFYPNQKNIKSIDQFLNEMDKYINFYNKERINSRLNYLSPLEYKKHYLELKLKV